jgi:hypothetical protein
MSRHSKKPKERVSKTTKKSVKNWQGTYIKLPTEAANALLKLQTETGKSKTRIIADSLTGERQFRPDVEHWLRDEAAKRGLSRQMMIEIFVAEAMAVTLKDQKISGK